MSKCPRAGYVLGILIVALLTCCSGRSGGDKVENQEPEETWTMSDEISEVQAVEAEEEALRMAAHDGDLEQVRKLHKQGVACDSPDQDGHTALMYAAFNGHSEIVIYLLDAGAEIDRTDYMGRTALLYCATGPFPETLKILLDRGADPNRVDSNEHFSPLMHAAAEGHLEVVKVLIGHGADRSLKDVDGDNAAAFAEQAGHKHIADYLNSITD